MSQVNWGLPLSSGGLISICSDRRSCHVANTEEESEWNRERWKLLPLAPLVRQEGPDLEQGLRQAQCGWRSTDELAISDHQNEEAPSAD